MSEPLPEKTGDPRDIEINYEPDDVGIKVAATLGDATITVEHAWGSGAEDAAFLVRALPNILIAVQEALEAQEAQQ